MITKPGNLKAMKQIEQLMINLPELDDETPFRFSHNHKKGNQNRITPKYAIENLKSIQTQQKPVRLRKQNITPISSREHC